jgi:hypothetical protein
LIDVKENFGKMINILTLFSLAMAQAILELARKQKIAVFKTFAQFVRAVI